MTPAVVEVAEDKVNLKQVESVATNEAENEVMEFLLVVRRSRTGC